MQKTKQLHKNRKKLPLSVVGIILIFAVMLTLYWTNKANSQQAIPAFLPNVYFDGQYRIGDGDWLPVKEGAHIPATQGDVTLQGQFHLVMPNGEYIGPADAGTLLAFYADHIHITVQEQGFEPYHLDVEYTLAGEGLCGVLCTAYELSTSGPVTLTFNNPHRFGNDQAIDHFLQELSVYGDLSYEKNFMAQGNLERNVGFAFVIAALLLLGTALFSTLLHIDGDRKFWLIGLCIFFAGGYFVFGARGVFFWSDSVIGNTTILGICLMLYMLCACTLIPSFLNRKLRKIGTVAVICLGAVCGLLALLCVVTKIRFYDTWLWWAITQSLVNILLLVCLALNFTGASKSRITTNIGAICLLLGFEVDFVGTAFGWWQGGLVSKYIFIALFIIAMALAWQIIPRNINAARKAKEMEAEQKVIRAQLQENRIAIMISQIQPHFIYNTLGTIYQLCKENPEQAAQLVHRFSLYLRGNFSELDSTVPIPFNQELEHVRCYTEIELVRFPDMTVNYDIQAEEFLLPALSVQPLVENAIKHGLMGLEEGGCITVSAFESPTHYCVRVTDDGVGFDELDLKDKKKHIGIRNVQERLQIMCDGNLTVESQKGKGTVALIQIPKEGKEL